MKSAWGGFANEAIIAIGGLLIVAAALRNTGALDIFGAKLLGNVKNERSGLFRLSCVVIPASAFLLNTAIVAMLLPVVIGWCRRLHISPSRVLLPISYLAILGGTCTLVGTSTNLVINQSLSDLKSDIAELPSSDLWPAERADYYSWLADNADAVRPMWLFEITAVGLPCALGGVLLILLTYKKLLPERAELLDSLEDQRREYLVEMTVSANCPLIGKSVEEGGLRSLPGLFLIEIDRDGEVIGPVSPRDRIQQNDRLVFAGVVATIVDLEKIPGLIPAADINYEISPAKADARSLAEVVLSPSSPLVGLTIRQANFRQLYGAAVVAVHRNGERLPRKIGDIELSPGDTLLLQTGHGFVRSFRNRPDFYLVSGVEDSSSRRHDKLIPSLLITVGLVIWLLLQPWLAGFALPEAFCSPPAAIFVAALILVATRCVSPAEARRAIDLPMLITIGAAIGIGIGFAECGAAESVAGLISNVIGSSGQSCYIALAGLFVATILLTEMISNIAVAQMMFYIAVSLASRFDVSPRPFIIAITLAASLSFISPIGYQTNLMVMGPGGYRPRDYLKAGLPLSIMVTVVAVTLIPMVWSF